MNINYQANITINGASFLLLIIVFYSICFYQLFVIVYV